jgi:hypothetical protein
MLMLSCAAAIWWGIAATEICRWPTRCTSTPHCSACGSPGHWRGCIRVVVRRARRAPRATSPCTSVNRQCFPVIARAGAARSHQRMAQRGRSRMKMVRRRDFSPPRHQVAVLAPVSSTLFGRCRTCLGDHGWHCSCRSAAPALFYDPSKKVDRTW